MDNSTRSVELGIKLKTQQYDIHIQALSYLNSMLNHENQFCVQWFICILFFKSIFIFYIREGV